MKITENINMKSAYASLAVVRGYMPSSDTVKSWTIEPVKSAWSKPATKVAFVAIGVMAAIAIGIKLASMIKSKSEIQQPKPTLEQQNLYAEFQDLKSKCSFEELKKLSQAYESSSAELSDDGKIMFLAVKDLTEIRRKSEASSIPSIHHDVMECINYGLGVIRQIPDGLDDAEYKGRIAEYSSSTLNTCVEAFKNLKDKFEKSNFRNEQTLFQNEMNVLQKIIKEKYQALSKVV